MQEAITTLLQNQIFIITSAARILHVEGFENDITFDPTLYTGADPESFGGVHVVLK